MTAARYRQEEAWDHTAAILAHLVNTNPFRGKGPPAKPADYHPLRRAVAAAKAAAKAASAGGELSGKQSVNILARMFGAV